MPNSLTSTGMTIATQAELLSNMTASLQAIYRANINIASNTPDGQWINIFIQSMLDIEELQLQNFNSFDPDNAVGVLLDQRCAINGVQRKGGTYTVTNITVVTSQSVNFYGLDQTVQPVYTVSDNAGNQWLLMATVLGSGTGTFVYAFQSGTPGAITTVPNTITVPVTIVLGVTSVNNPTTYTTLGISEETDAQLKIRRAQSVSLASQGYYAGLYAALNNLNGVTSVYIEENDTSTTNGDGVPGHSIWVIVGGSATAAQIANVIYVKRNAGCGMYGSQSYTITQIDGSPFQIFWDDVVPENLFISFTATSLDGVNPPNLSAILAQLPTLFVPGVHAEVNITTLGTAIQSIDANTLVTFTSSGTPATGGFSTAYNGSYTNTLTPNAKNKQFAVSSANIIALPMLLSPYNPLTANPVSVTHGNTQQFTGLGGYGTLTYSFVTNNSGGSINSSSGLYTAGSTHPATDTIKVTDSLSNTAQAVISVV